MNTLFIGLVGAIALAAGLAFGLGGKDVASQITQAWYESGKKAADKIKEQSESGWSPQPTTRPTVGSYPSRTPVPQAGD